MANNGPNVDLYDERHRNISLKLLRMFNESDQKANLIMSPYSIDRVLLVAYFGAANKTKQSLEQLLCLDTADKQAVANSFHVLAAILCQLTKCILRMMLYVNFVIRILIYFLI